MTGWPGLYGAMVPRPRTGAFVGTVTSASRSLADLRAVESRADIRRATPRGPLSARKRTLAIRFSELRRFMSAYRSEADAELLIRRGLLLTHNGHSLASGRMSPFEPICDIQARWTSPKFNRSISTL